MKKLLLLIALLGPVIPGYVYADCTLRQSTLKVIEIGPFVDPADGVTELTALSNPAIKLSKNHAVIVTRSSATTVTHDANGYYRVELNATDTNTAGDLRVFSSNSASYPQVKKDCLVYPSQVYDSLISGADVLQTNVMQIGSDVTAGVNLKSGVNTTGTGTVGVGSTTTSIVTSSIDPAASVTNQFLDRIVIFDRATTTAALRGQAANITASTAGGVLTVTALTTAPVNGDDFTIQ